MESDVISAGSARLCENSDYPVEIMVGPDEPVSRWNDCRPGRNIPLLPTGQRQLELVLMLHQALTGQKQCGRFRTYC